MQPHRSCRAHCHSPGIDADILLLTICERKQLPWPERFPHHATPLKEKKTRRVLRSGDSIKKVQVNCRGLITVYGPC